MIRKGRENRCKNVPILCPNNMLNYIECMALYIHEEVCTIIKHN